MVFDNNNLDGRPTCAPNNWNKHFRIFYLTEKMRCQNDVAFASLCDRVGRGSITEDDLNYLKSRVQSTEAENENFKSGKLSTIVTTNLKRNLVNMEKLSTLLPNEREYSCNSVDRITNLPSGQKIPERLKTNLGKTGNLETELKLKVGAPVVITSNHSKQKFREDGFVNGARGYVQSIQVSKEDPEKVDIIWVVFKHESICKLYRFSLVTPVFRGRVFCGGWGTSFPLQLAKPSFAYPKDLLIS